MFRRFRIFNRVKLLEAVSLELVERVEALENPEQQQPWWPDRADELMNMDPAVPLSGELVHDSPGGFLWDDDGWSVSGYL